MSNFANWISPELLRTLGWTLLHFLWQGAGLRLCLPWRPRFAEARRRVTRWRWARSS